VRALAPTPPPQPSSVRSSHGASISASDTARAQLGLTEPGGVDDLQPLSPFQLERSVANALPQVLELVGS